MYKQKEKIDFSLYNYIIIFLVYIRNIIEYYMNLEPKKKYAKIYPILDSNDIYDEENGLTEHIIDFNSQSESFISYYINNNNFVKQKPQLVNYTSKSKLD